MPSLMYIKFDGSCYYNERCPFFTIEKREIYAVFLFVIFDKPLAFDANKIINGINLRKSTKILN